MPDTALYSPGLPPRAQSLLAPVQVPWVLLIFLGVLAARVMIVGALQSRLAGKSGASGPWWLVPARDILGVAIWAASFLGNTVQWRGKKFRLTREGKLISS